MTHESRRAAAVRPLRMRLSGRTPAARLVFVLALLLPTSVRAADRPRVYVGSKSFAENVILGEMLCHLIADAGGRPVHLYWLGDTGKAWNGLVRGDLDVYVEYTGTLAKDILEGENLADGDDAALREALARHGLRMSSPLGFNNTYALAVKARTADDLGIHKLSELIRYLNKPDHKDLKFGFSHPFLERADGWAKLKGRGLPQHVHPGRALDHSFVYKALKDGTLDVTDVYSTEPQTLDPDLKLLEDDIDCFPKYYAVILYRTDLLPRAPKVVDSLLRLQGQINDKEMTALNARVVLHDVHEIQATADYLSTKLTLHVPVVIPTMWQNILLWTGEHLFLVALSLAVGIVIAVPLGVLAARKPWLGQAVLAAVGVVQTVPALALLFFLSVLLGLGVVPALVALFFYSLLPIVRNTYTGLKDIPIPLRESAEALGLSPLARLRLIELPLAARSILAGIKTAAVINVGNATLGGLIAAGGYGTPIIIGLNKNNVGILLQGAIPAVLMALAIIVLFEVVERFTVSPGLRLKG